MISYNIEFNDRDTVPDTLEALAVKLHLTPELLIKRFIVDGLTSGDTGNKPTVPGTSLEDFLVKNGAWKKADRS